MVCDAGCRKQNQKLLAFDYRLQFKVGVLFLISHKGDIFILQTRFRFIHWPKYDTFWFFLGLAPSSKRKFDFFWWASQRSRFL